MRSRVMPVMSDVIFEVYCMFQDIVQEQQSLYCSRPSVDDFCRWFSVSNVVPSFRFFAFPLRFHAFGLVSDLQIDK